MTDTSPVLIERRGAIAIVRLNKPERRNAFDLQMRAAIAQAVYEVRDNPDIRVMVLTGSGGAFCAGGDLKALAEGRRPVAADRDRIRRLHPWFRELVNLEKPVVAAVEGPAFGAGFNLALACDYVVAAPDARFCAVFARIGLVPDLGGFFLLPRIVGLQRAKEIVFSAREIDAQEAQSLGIVATIAPPGAALDVALDVAARFETASPDAIGMAKNVLNRSFSLDYDTLAELESYAQALAIQSDYHREAVDNFLNKRPLKFRSPRPPKA